jgi:hypothetical protein
VRTAGSSGANPFACISSGVASLWGPAHGGANEAVLKMLTEIGDEAHIGEYIKRVKDFEEALTISNSSRFANGSCIFTESGYYSREFAKRTHAGMVGINVGIPVPVSFFPFAGHKESFFGESHCLGADGVQFFTETKCVTSRWFTEVDKAQKKVAAE